MNIKISKKIKWLIIVIVILLFSHVFGFSILYVESINNSLNSLIVPVYKIPTNCDTDADCKMAQIDCSICSCSSKGAVVNVNYEPFCPIPRPLAIGCMACVARWQATEAVCENNQCVERNGLKKYLEDI